MRPKKGSGAERLGIDFSGNPDARDYVELIASGFDEGPSIFDSPGRYLVGSLSGDQYDNKEGS